MIEDTIAKIEARIQSADPIQEDKLRELQNLLATLKAEVAALSQTNVEQARSISGFTDLSTHEAIRKDKNPTLLTLSLKGMSTSVEGFEASHPKLVQVVNSISNYLANMGI